MRACVSVEVITYRFTVPGYLRPASASSALMMGSCNWEHQDQPSPRYRHFSVDRESIMYFLTRFYSAEHIVTILDALLNDST